jgi:hypothetical protein
VGGGEPQGLVEADGVRPPPVRRQLDQAAALPARHLDRPLDHPPAEPVAALAGGDADALDLRPQHAVPAQPGDHGQLQRPDDAPARLRDQQLVALVGRDPLERRVVGVVGRPLAAGPDRVIGQQRHDLRHVLAPRLAQQRRPRCRCCLLRLHPVSVAGRLT